MSSLNKEESTDFGSTALAKNNGWQEYLKVLEKPFSKNIERWFVIGNGKR